jgi:hypothetical protein
MSNAKMPALGASTGTCSSNRTSEPSVNRHPDRSADNFAGIARAGKHAAKCVAAVAQQFVGSSR